MTCIIDYRKLNSVTNKDHFSLLFIDQMLDKLTGHEFYCFLDGYLGYNQILIAPKDQEKTTSLALLTLFHIGECHFDYVMHLPHFNYAC